MDTYGGNGGITLTLDAGERSASRSGRFTHRLRSCRHPSDKRLGGPQSRSGGGGEENLCPCRESDPGRHPVCET